MLFSSLSLHIRRPRCSFPGLVDKRIGAEFTVFRCGYIFGWLVALLILPFLPSNGLLRCRWVVSGNCTNSRSSSYTVALLFFLGFLSFFFSSSFVSPLIFSFYFFVIRQLGVSSCGTQPKPKSWFIVNNSANGPGAHFENCGYLWLARAGLIPKSSSSHWCAIFSVFVFIFPYIKKEEESKPGGREQR